VSQMQLDLFGELELAEDTQTEAERVQAAKAAALAEQRAAFLRRVTTHPDGTPVLWTAPWDTYDLKAGDTCPGWRCPACGQIEGGEYGLALNHGFADYLPYTWGRTWCTRQLLLRSQAVATAQRTSPCHQRPDGTCRTESARGPHPAGGLITRTRDADPALHCPCECHSHNGCPDPSACQQEIP
jgi:hypothetical protein